MKLPKEKEQTKAPSRGIKINAGNGVSGRVRAASDNPELYERLRMLRNDTAKQQKVPAYVVFADRTLLEMSTYLPVTKEEMLMINGVAQAKYEKYGQIFIEEIKKYKSENEEKHQPPTAKPKIKFTRV